MRWQGRRESDNVEDRRGQGSGSGSGGLGGMRLPIRGKSGIVILIVVLVAGYYGVDLSPLLDGGQSGGAKQQTRAQSISPKDDQQAKFTSVILASTEDTWKEIFRRQGQTYVDPKLVMYRGSTRTGCGTGQSVMGPFYCPADTTVYIDLSFYQALKDKLGAGGAFAQAYVIAHEVGHHVQHLMGIDTKVRQMQQDASQTAINQLSVKMELQADCFAGVWGHSQQQQNMLEEGDLKEALDAAQAIGDDRLQQRYTWFKRGFDSGDPNQCNTFASR